ncbi:MAG: NAD(P)-dependent oxidoreductase [Acidobacteriota bacterium]|nr:NAD(P)-dependent oxidoreductase [Acidobacteriota bacterium]
MELGFIGLGKMGTGMAQNLLRAGHKLTVYNRTPEKVAALVKEGATAARTPADVARNSEALFTMLSDDRAVREVVFGENGMVAALPHHALHVSSSTISVALARELAGEHLEREQMFVSGPVFGRPDSAQAKKLIVILAGNDTSVARAKPLADAIGRQTFVAGSEPWQANALKLCGNFMIASMIESFGEAFAVMRKAGIDEHHFLNAMIELFGSPVYKNYGTNVAERKFEPAGFELKLGLKDIKLALEAAEGFGASMPFASILRDHFVSALARGQEKLDWSSLALVSARAAGLE